MLFPRDEAGLGNQVSLKVNESSGVRPGSHCKSIFIVTPRLAHNVLTASVR